MTTHDEIAEEEQGMDKITLYSIIACVLVVLVLLGGGIVAGLAWMFWIALIATPVIFLVLMALMLNPNM